MQRLLGVARALAAAMGCGIQATMVISVTEVARGAATAHTIKVNEGADGTTNRGTAQTR